VSNCGNIIFAPQPFGVVYVSYWSIPKKQLHPFYLRKIQRVPYAYGFQ